MPYEVAIDKANAVVRVRIHGTVSFDENCAARAEAARVLGDTGFHRLFVNLRDLTSNERGSTADCYDFGASYTQSGIPPSIRMAIVLPRDPARRSNVKFILTVAANRGMSTREFDDPETAHAWLLESEG
jgi:hypothetical protein